MDKRVGKSEPQTMPAGTYNGTATRKTDWQLLPRSNPELPADPATPLQGLYSATVKTWVHTKTRTGVSTAALLLPAPMPSGMNRYVTSLGVRPHYGM